MQSPIVPFSLSPEQCSAQLRQFNARTEIAWFGFEGALQAPGSALITFTRLPDGVLGGGGTAAINGGVIAAGFDAAFVLAGLTQYDVDVVVTLELSIKFLSLAQANKPLAFRVHVVRSSRRFAFVEGFLGERDAPTRHFAIATAMVAPVV